MDKVHPEMMAIKENPELRALEESLAQKRELLVNQDFLEVVQRDHLENLAQLENQASQETTTQKKETMDPLERLARQVRRGRRVQEETTEYLAMKVPLASKEYLETRVAKEKKVLRAQQENTVELKPISRENLENPVMVESRVKSDRLVKMVKTVRTVQKEIEENKVKVVSRETME